MAFAVRSHRRFAALVLLFAPIVCYSVPEIEFMNDCQSLAVPTAVHCVFYLAAVAAVRPAGITVGADDQVMSIVAKVFVKLTSKTSDDVRHAIPGRPLRCPSEAKESVGKFKFRTANAHAANSR